MSRRKGDQEPLIGDAHEDDPVAPKRRFIVIEPLMILYIVSGFPMMSLTSQFLVHKVAESMGYDYDNLTRHNNASSTCVIDRNDSSYIIREQITAEAATWNMYKTLVDFIPGLISPLVLGSLADILGRRILFVLPCIGSMLSTGIYMAIIWFDLPLYCVLFCAIEQFFGGFGAIFTGAFAYISDTVPPNKRSFRMTIIDAVSMGNGAIANLFVGYWIEDQGFFYPLVFVVSGKFLCMLYGLFCVPETLKKDQTEKRKLSCKDLVSALKLSLYDNGTGRRWKINIILLSFVVSDLLSTMSIMTIFEMNTPLCWDSIYIGYYSFVVVMVQCVMMLIVSKLPNHWIAAEWKIVASRASGFAHTVFLGFVTTSVMMYIAPAVGCISFLAIPMMRYVLSILVEKNEQASVFALMSVLMHMAMFISSMTSNKLYAETLFILNGSLVFFASGGCLFISLLLMLLTCKVVTHPRPSYVKPTIDPTTSKYLCLYIYKTREDRRPIDAQSKPGERIGSIQA